MANNLKKIISEAKKIRKDHPHMEWKNALKEAGVHLRNAVKPVVSVAKHKAKKSIKRGLISLAKSKHLNGVKFTKDDALKMAIKMGVDFNKDYHAQSFGHELTELAKKAKYRKSASSSGSLGRSFFYHLQKIYDKKHIHGMEGWYKGNTLFVEKFEVPKRVSRNHPTLVVERAKKKRGNRKKGTFRHFIQIGALPTYKDPDMAREIQLYADNDSLLYTQRRKPILINLSKKYRKGTYDVDKASKLWRYYIDASLQKYHKEFGGRGKWYDLLSVPDRNLLAHEYAVSTLEEFNSGNLYA